MNPFIEASKDRLLDTAQQTKVLGIECFVIKLSNHDIQNAFQEAERMARIELSDDKKELSAIKLSRSEKKAIADDFNDKDIHLGKNVIDSLYDKYLLSKTFSNLSVIMRVESLRTFEGEKIYTNQEDRKKLMEILGGSTDLMEQIDNMYKEKGE